MKKISFMRLVFLSISLILIVTGFLQTKNNFMICIIGGILILGLIFFDINASKIANLSEENPKVKTIRMLNRLTICIIIMFILSMLILQKNNMDIENNNILVLIIFSVFIIIFGNVAPKIPFNRYLGFRLPWTIRDEETWKLAHKILGYLSFPIVGIMILASIFFEFKFVATTTMIIWILIPGVYSYIFYERKFKELK